MNVALVLLILGIVALIAGLTSFFWWGARRMDRLEAEREWMGRLR